MYRHAGIDIFLDPAIHGRGVGPDAVRALCVHLVDDVGHHRLVIDPAADNAAGDPLLRQGRLPARRRDAPLRARTRRRVARRAADGPARRRARALTVSAPGSRRRAASRSTAPGRLGATSSAARWIAVPRGVAGRGRQRDGDHLVERRCRRRRRASGRSGRTPPLPRAAPTRPTAVMRARGIITVSASTTGSWTTSPAGTATSQRRLAGASGAAARHVAATATTLATAATTHAAGRPRERRGDDGGDPHGPRHDGGHEVAERRAQREAALVAVRRRLHVHLPGVGRRRRARPPRAPGRARARTLDRRRAGDRRDAGDDDARRARSPRTAVSVGTPGTARATAPHAPRRPRADGGHELHRRRCAPATASPIARPPTSGDGEPRQPRAPTA